MRIAIVTESFLPTVNGVSNSVARVTEVLEGLGHQVLIVAPGAGPSEFSRSRVVRTAWVPLPGYTQIPVGMPTSRASAELEAFSPDVVHAGGPFTLGAWGLAAARRLGVPGIAVYQTDFPRFARHYRVGAAEGLAWRWLRRVHSLAALTLAPSSAAAWDLRRRGVGDVAIWGRGVDLARFTPARRDPALRAALAPAGQVLVGYVGRLAPEKDVCLLRALTRVPHVQLVVVGDGPQRQRLARRLPRAHFVGFKTGAALPKHVASLDILVHTGAHETFCQTIQEALASGVPVVAPAVGGPLDLVRHGRNGLLFRPGDGRSLRTAVRALAADDERRGAMAAAAREGVRGRSWRRLVDELVGHYTAALAGDRLERGATAPTVELLGVR